MQHKERDLRYSLSRKSSKRPKKKIREKSRSSFSKGKRHSSVKNKSKGRHKRLLSLNNQQFGSTLFQKELDFEDERRKSMTTKEFISTVYERMQRAEIRKNQKIASMKLSIKQSEESPSYCSKRGNFKDKGLIFSKRESLKRSKRLKEFLSRMKRDIVRRTKNKHKSIFDSSNKKLAKEFEEKECVFQPNKELSELRRDRRLSQIRRIDKLINNSSNPHSRENIRIVAKERFHPLMKPSTGGSSRKSSVTGINSKWESLGYYRTRKKRRSQRQSLKRTGVNSLRESKKSFLKKFKAKRRNRSSKNVSEDSN